MCRLASGDVKNNARIASAWRTAADCDLLLFIMDAARQVGLPSEPFPGPCDYFKSHNLCCLLDKAPCLHLSSLWGVLHPVLCATAREAHLLLDMKIWRAYQPLASATQHHTKLNQLAAEGDWGLCR